MLATFAVEVLLIEVFEQSLPSETSVSRPHGEIDGNFHFAVSIRGLVTVYKLLLRLNMFH